MAEMPSSEAGMSVERAKGLENLATLAHERGDIARALQYRRQALQLKRDGLGTSSLTYARSLCNLAVLELEMEQGDTAEMRLREAIRIYEAVHGPDHPALLHPLDGLAGALVDRRDLKNAEQIYERMARILRGVEPGHERDRSRLLKRLARLYQETLDADRAESQFREALSIWERSAAGLDLEYVDCLACFGIFLLKQSRLAEAESVFRKVRSLLEDDPTFGYQFLFMSLIGLVLAVHPRDRLEALAFLDEAIHAEDRLIERDFTDPEEQTRTERQERSDLTLGLYAYMALREFRDDPSVARRLVELIYRRANLSEEMLLRQRGLAFGEMASVAGEKLRALDDLRSSIAQRAAEGPRSRWVEEAHESPRLTEMRERERALRAELLTIIPTQEVVRQVLAFGLEDVGQVLPAGAALLEIARVRALSPSEASALFEGQRLSGANAIYLGALIEPQSLSSPLVLNLGEAAEIDRHVSTFLGHVSTHPRNRPAGSEGTASQSAAALWRTLVAPFMDRLAACNHLFVVPDGELWRLPWGVLSAEDGTFLTDRFEISYLASARDLPRCQAQPVQLTAPPVVIADPDFNLAEPDQGPCGQGGWPRSDDDPSDEDRHLVPAKTASTAAELAFGMGNVELAGLPGSRAEGTRVAALLGVEPWLDDIAVKARVKALHSPYILHVATHGLFLADAMEWEQLQNTRKFGGRVINMNDMMAQSEQLSILQCRRRRVADIAHDVTERLAGFL
jgi:tetratricopeptide (TPR) repeat protein